MKWINIDCDGVLADHSKVILEILSEKHGIDYKMEEWTSWDEQFTEEISAGSLIAEAYSQYPYRYLLGMKTIPGSKECLERLYEYYNIRIVTHRPLKFKEETISWLDKYNFKYDDISFTENKYKNDCEGEVIIDDNPEVINNSNKDYPILFLKQYNKNNSTGALTPDKSINYHNILSKQWKDIVNLIKGLDY